MLVCGGQESLNLIFSTGTREANFTFGIFSESIFCPSSPHFAKARDRFQAKNSQQKELLVKTASLSLSLEVSARYCYAVWAADGGRHPAGTSTFALRH